MLVTMLYRMDWIGFGWTRKVSHKPHSGRNGLPPNVSSCCIDKSSSAELSEAIYSMFRWYKKAEVCYAYLVDVLGDEIPEHEASEFAKSRWFTRGWTLRELVAPSNVTFYSKNWNNIGTKERLCDLLSQITGIDLETLRGKGLELVSVARRMSWAAKRT